MKTVSIGDSSKTVSYKRSRSIGPLFKVGGEGFSILMGKITVSLSVQLWSIHIQLQG